MIRSNCKLNLLYLPKRAAVSRPFSERADIYCRQKARVGKATIRIGKNMHRKTHVCLIPWEELNALSAKESAITGKEIDYQAMDTNNVLAVPQLLKPAEE